MSAEPIGDAERTNPLHRFAGRLVGALGALSGSPAWAMSAAEQAETLMELSQAMAQLAELRLRVLVAADRNEIGADRGATSTAAWLAAHTRQRRAAAFADLRLATSLDDPAFALTRAALAAGAVNVDQARVIVAAIDDLPREGEDAVSDFDRERAQAHLIELAAECDAKRLRECGKRLFEVIAPEEADRREGEALEAEERRARERTRFSMRDNGDGTWTGSFKVPALHAMMLKKALDAFTSPRRAGSEGLLDADGKRIPYARRLGQGFCELIEHLPVDKLPQAGGVAATVLVRLEYGTLLSGIGAASLDTGDRISAGEARRMACNAGIVPVVLGGPSVPLDLGRTRRLHSVGQRIAIADRDEVCTAQGCDRPAAWCEIHHDQPWSEGGHTTVEGGRLFCSRHHHYAHDARYAMTKLPGNQVRFSRRT
jgi:Domain of unknown function (DUF222)